MLSSIYTTEAAMDDKIPFHALDLRNISRLVKTKTKSRAQCLMVNTRLLTTTIHAIFLIDTSPKDQRHTREFKVVLWRKFLIFCFFLLNYNFNDQKKDKFLNLNQDTLFLWRKHVRHYSNRQMVGPLLSVSAVFLWGHPVNRRYNLFQGKRTKAHGEW